MSGGMYRDAGKPMVRDVLAAVQVVLGYTPTMIRSRDRSHPLVDARHTAIYVAHLVCGRTLGELGRGVNRDHATIGHSIERIALLSKVDPLVGRWLEDIKRQTYIEQRKRMEQERAPAAALTGASAPAQDAEASETA